MTEAPLHLKCGGPLIESAWTQLLERIQSASVKGGETCEAARALLRDVEYLRGYHDTDVALAAALCQELAQLGHELHLEPHFESDRLRVCLEGEFIILPILGHQSFHVRAHELPGFARVDAYACCRPGSSFEQPEFDLIGFLFADELNAEPGTGELLWSAKTVTGVQESLARLTLLARDRRNGLSKNKPSGTDVHLLNEQYVDSAELEAVWGEIFEYLMDGVRDLAQLPQELQQAIADSTELQKRLNANIELLRRLSTIPKKNLRYALPAFATFRQRALVASVAQAMSSALDSLGARVVSSYRIVVQEYSPQVAYGVRSLGSPTQSSTTAAKMTEIIFDSDIKGPTKMQITPQAEGYSVLILGGGDMSIPQVQILPADAMGIALTDTTPLPYSKVEGAEPGYTYWLLAGNYAVQMSADADAAAVSLPLLLPAVEQST